MMNKLSLKNAIVNYFNAKSNINEIINSLSKFKNKRTDKILDLPDDEFYPYCYTLSSQKYGLYFQNRFQKQNNLEKVKSSEEMGDLKNKFKYFEYKMSYINSESNSVNMVQIRPNHKYDYCIFQVADARDLSNIKLDGTYILSKNELLKEALVNGNNAAHGNKLSAQELRMTIKIGSEQWQRFQTEYKKPNNFDLNTLI